MRNSLLSVTVLLWGFLLWLVCPLSALPLFAKSNPTDAQVDRVQTNFQFTFADSRGIDHDTLKQYLLIQNGDATFLQQGLQLCNLIDLQKRFGENHYYEATTELNANLVLAALGYPSAPKADLSGALSVAKDVLKLKFPNAGKVIGIYDAFEQLHAEYQFIDAVAERGQASAINELVRDYTANVSDADNDQDDWTELYFDVKAKGIERSFKARRKTFDVHEFCRAQWKMQKELDKNLQSDISTYKAAFRKVLQNYKVETPESPKPKPKERPVPSIESAMDKFVDALMKRDTKTFLSLISRSKGLRMFNTMPGAERHPVTDEYRLRTASYSQLEKDFKTKGL